MSAGITSLPYNSHPSASWADGVIPDRPGFGNFSRHGTFGVNAINSDYVPSVFERQEKKTGLTYEDPDLVSTQVGGSAHRDHKLGVGNKKVQRDPVAKASRLAGWDYGFLVPSRPERKVLAHLDQNPISHVGMFSGLFGTEHSGWYLDRKK